jgi:hypothetical protein
MNYCLSMIFSLFGFVFNMASLVVFTLLLRESKHSNELFKYYWLKKLCESILSLLYATTAFSRCFNLPTTYEFQVFRLVFVFYFAFCLSMIKIFLEFAATFNLYRKLTQIFRLLDKIPIYIIILTFSGAAFVFYIYIFFEREITERNYFNSSSIEIFYDIGKTNFHFTPIGKALRLSNSLIRDGLFVFLIIFMNILILIKLKQIVSFNNSTTRNNKKARANIRIAFMVILSSILVAISHIFLLVEYIVFLESLKQGTDLTQAIMLFLMYFLSPSGSFFAFYLFNKAFSKKVKGIFLGIKRLFLHI